MDVYRELQMQIKRRFGRLARGALATIGTAVAAAGLANAIGATEALAEQPQVSKRGQVTRGPVSRLAPGEGIDFANAIPTPLPESALRPAPLAEAMRKAPALRSAKPGSRAGAPGNGNLRPAVLAPPKLPGEGATDSPAPSDDIVPQQFGALGHPYTTSRVNAFFDDTVVHYPFSAAGKLFYNIRADTFWCSACLIAPGIVVTAAHCVAEFGTGQYFTNWQYAPAYNNGVAPFGVSTAKAVWVLRSWLDGTDFCMQEVACWDDVAVITLNSLNGTYVGSNTGWLGFGWNLEGITADLRYQITQLGYPDKLDGGQLMERTDAVSFYGADFAANNIIGSLMTGGSNGGPWVTNLGIQPSLSGTSFGAHADPNRVVGTTSWGYTADDIKLQGASPFTSDNVLTLFQGACDETPAACQ